MKKLIYILTLVVVVLTASCSCVLSQVPPQTIYADANCEATLPDYRPQVLASDNCGDVTLSQAPEPGTLLTPANPALDVLITATDQFGNTAFLNIPVSMIDTIPPILEWVGGVASMSDKEVLDMYDNWSQAVKYYGIAEWIYNRAWQPDTLLMSETAEQSLWYFTHTIALDSTEYNEYLSFKNE